MTINDLIKIYETKKKKYGMEAYRHISNVLREAKEQHGKDFTGNDHEQSWRAFKGKNLEKLIGEITQSTEKMLISHCTTEAPSKEDCFIPHWEILAEKTLINRQI